MAEYVDLLRGFGLDDAEIVSAHGIDPGVEDPDPVGHLRVHFEGDPATGDLHDRLRDILADSSRGIDADREYWDGVVEDQVGAVLVPYGYALGVDANAPGADLRITVEDRVSGETREREFVYPTGSDGDDYSAVLAAVEDLLGRDELAFVRLRTDRRRFVLVEEDALGALRSEYGDRVEAFGRPLLADRQPGGSPEDSPGESGGSRGESGSDGASGESGSDGSPGDSTAGGLDVDDLGTSDPADWPTPDAPGDESSPTASPGTGDDAGDDPGLTPDRDPELEPDPGSDPDPDDTSPSPPGDGPAWLRRAVASEGGIDEVVDALDEGGPRTHVSDRTADDVLAELSSPDADRVEGTTTTGPGIDEVFDQMDDGGDSSGGTPDEVVSERGIDDVFEEIESAAEPPDEVHAGGGESVATESGGGAATTTVEADDLLERSGSGGFEAIAGGTPDEVVSDRGLDDVFGTGEESDDVFEESDDLGEVVSVDTDPGDAIAGSVDADSGTAGSAETGEGDAESEVEALFDSMESTDPDAIAEGDPDPATGTGSDAPAEGGTDPATAESGGNSATVESGPDTGTGSDPGRTDPGGVGGPDESAPGSTGGEPATDREVDVEDVIELAEDDDFDSPFAGSGDETADAADTDLDAVTTDAGFDDLADDGQSDPDEVLEDADSIQDLIVDVGGDRPDRPESFDPDVPIRDAEARDEPAAVESRDEPAAVESRDEPDERGATTTDPGAIEGTGPEGTAEPERTTEPESADAPMGTAELEGTTELEGTAESVADPGSETTPADPGESTAGDPGESTAGDPGESTAGSGEETASEESVSGPTDGPEREGTPVDTVDWMEAAERSSAGGGASQSAAEARASGTDDGGSESDDGDRESSIAGRVRSLVDRLFGR